MGRIALRAAFRAAAYGPPGERFRPGEVDAGWTPSWAAGRRTWAIITAWNPHGVTQPDERNAAAAGQLLRLVTAAYLPVVNGEGGWAEDALLLPGAGLRDAATLGHQFGQVAVLFGVGRRVALVWLDGGVRVERFWAVPHLP